MKYLTLKSIRSSATLIFMIPILFGCSKQKMTQENATAQKDKEQKLEEFFVSVGEAVISGDKYAYANLFTTDGTLFLPDRQPIIGREAVANWYEKFYNKMTHITDSYDQEKVDIVGDIAIVRSHGTGSYIIRETEEQIPLKNKFIDVLKFTNDKWLWMYHMASSFTFDPGLWDRDWEKEGGSFKLTELERRTLESEIVDQLNDYADAIISRNINEILSFWSNSGDFVMGGGGSIIGGYDEWEKIAIRDNNQTSKWIYWNWNNVNIAVLSKESASATVEFDYKKISIQADTINGYGSWTYVFLKKNGQWKVIQSNGHHPSR